MIPKSVQRFFGKRSCSSKMLKRDDDSKEKSSRFSVVGFDDGECDAHAPVAVSHISPRVAAVLPARLRIGLQEAPPGRKTTSAWMSAIRG